MSNKVNALNSGVISALRSETRKLTATQNRLRWYLLEHTVDAGYMSLNELARAAGVSEVSVLSFCGLMGFDSFIALREALRDYTRERMRNIFTEPLPPALTQERHEELYRYCAGITDHHNEMVRGIDPAKLEKCARALAASQNILIFGHDMSKIAADYLASRLTYLCIRSLSVNLGDNDTVQMLLSALGPNDSVIIFSFLPYYMPAGDVADYVRHCGATLITIANDADSPVVLEDGINFLCRSQNPYFFNSMSVPLHFVEILAYYVAAVMGKKSEDITNIINVVGSYFFHNKNREDG